MKQISEKDTYMMNFAAIVGYIRALKDQGSNYLDINGLLKFVNDLHETNKWPSADDETEKKDENTQNEA